jgi:hypothetical protein
MGIVLDGHRIARVSIVDDDKYSRESYGLPLEEMDIEAIPRAGPLGDADALAASLPQESDALLCDHHLRKRNYATFNGGALVEKCYARGFPAILCTGYEKADILELRKFRRSIPVLLKPSELSPDSLLTGFDVVVRELNGTFRPERKPWRTLVRIEEVVDDPPGIETCYATIPGWRPDEVTTLRVNDLPDEVQRVIRTTGAPRLHARVNIGAETQEELFFTDWETE